MFATTYVIVNKIESSQFIQRHKQGVERMAHEIIRQHEYVEPMLGQHARPFAVAPPDGGRAEQAHHRDQGGGRRGKARGMIITSGTGEVVFEARFRKKETELIEFTVNSSAGNEYTVIAAKPPIPRFFEEVLGRFYSLQFILIFIASTLVSIFLSWSISKPLSQLGQFSRKYTAGAESESIPQHLLDRGDELADLAGDMAFMIDKIEDTLSAQQHLLHDVSHELRAPLARLQATIGLIELQSADRHTERLHKECKRIDTLIQEILNFSRLNREKEERHKHALGELIKGVISDLQIEHPKREFKLADSSNNAVAQVYESALCRSLENILRNACKYSPPDTAIETTLRLTSTHIIISIRDHGPGIAANDLNLVTKPFYRAGNQMHTEGFGLGLSIAQKGMEKHSGKLDIVNHAEGGLEVTCLLPIGK